jgi:hypothetical protein
MLLAELFIFEMPVEKTWLWVLSKMLTIILGSVSILSTTKLPQRIRSHLPIAGIYAYYVGIMALPSYVGFRLLNLYTLTNGLEICAVFFIPSFFISK